MKAADKRFYALRKLGVFFKKNFKSFSADSLNKGLERILT
jgi:hypothetical protein